jgi:hypothetical protein
VTEKPSVQLIRLEGSWAIKVFRVQLPFRSYEEVALDNEEYATLRALMIEREYNDVDRERELMRADLLALMKAVDLILPDGSLPDEYAGQTSHALMQMAIERAEKDHELAWQYGTLEK